ncbi:MAG: Bax inhibitor-1/YccA family protein [Clostridiales bacterium]|jgi:FtsH-binding integral membrane protein|nr:Bax inhibitor-1/YccA family protein [Clostridiales bacterium]
MDNYNNETYVDYDRSRAAGLSAFMTRVYGWMSAGLAISGVTAFLFLIFVSPLGIYRSPLFSLAAIGVQFALVIGLSAKLKTMRPATAKTLYCLYAVVSGITLSYIFLVYSGMPLVIFKAFLMTAVFFVTMTIFGMTTKSDLSGAGRMFMAALVTVIIVSVVNFFLGSALIEYIICYVGVAIFIGLTAYDTQKMKSFYITSSESAGAEMTSKAAIYGALQLYLDFINIFIYLLRILGRKR